ncbi:alpha/beta hydrolase [uncultured Shewanella sp.]|uniref:alpha/beta hydrolase n=1 Tax=uncultured Shewanella sp. TaxID=173975 RepID=UPI002624618A|nr:alpha/beta hydrolase [uncultured Shewanella sp.]
MIEHKQAMLDYQLNPTLWTPRITPNECIPAHITFCESHSKAYKESLKDNELYSIPYSYRGMKENIDVFRPNHIPNNATIIVYIHGGWWQWFSKDMFSYIAKPFNHAGAAVYIPAYTLAQNWTNDDPMGSIAKQLEYAMLEIFKEAEKKGAKKIVLVGHSAGGQLVSLLRNIDWQSQYGVSKAVVNLLSSAFSLAGLFDLTELVNSYINDEIGMTQEQAQSVSPLLHSKASDDRDLPPLYLVLPEYDTAEFFRQTKEYQQRLIKQNEQCRMKVLDGKDHVSMIESLIDTNDELFQYILKRL